MTDCLDVVVTQGLPEILEPEEAWLAAEIDALFAAAHQRRCRCVARSRTTTAFGRAARRRIGGTENPDGDGGGRRPSSRGGRQRAPPSRWWMPDAQARGIDR
jgi:hypothetical protein